VGKRLTPSETFQLFEDMGFEVLDTLTGKECIKDKLNIVDKEGYLYYISRDFLSIGYRHDENYKPERFAKQNPYTIENIKHWIYMTNKPYSFVSGECLGCYIGNLYLQCNCCGEIWNTSWAIMSVGMGCPFCRGLRINYNNSLAKERPDLVEEWDFVKNGDLTPDKIAPRSEKPVWWKCLGCGWSWKAKPANRNKIKGTNCPHCRRSIGEINVEKFLVNHSIIFDPNHTFDNCKYKRCLKFDFYLSELNICIEYNGEQHYMPKTFGSVSKEKAIKNYNKQLILDSIKENYCIENNIGFIKIPYWDFDNIESILSDRLNV
jgi:hypothetical protein